MFFGDMGYYSYLCTHENKYNDEKELDNFRLGTGRSDAGEGTMDQLGHLINHQWRIWRS